MQPIPERADPDDPDPDRMRSYLVDFDKGVLSEKASVTEPTATVTLNAQDPVEVSGLSFFTLNPVAEGITDLSVSYSCSTGEEFF